MTVTILKGDCREVLKTLPDESVHCVVTSPPYWGLRDYGVAAQIGLEPSPAEFVEQMVAIFRDVRRVLRNDGTLWLNLGDSYMGGGRGGGAENCKQRTNVGSLDAAPNQRVRGYKQKDLVGIPWLVAFALRADGWYLRQDIIWSKPNPMPENITDRCTKAHEYIFLLSKNARYYYDQDAILEPAADARRLSSWDERKETEPVRRGDPGQSGHVTHTATLASRDGRNKRSVWEIATAPFSDAHFATFPPALIEPCILAGCPKECCAKCGAPWTRDVERTAMVISRSEHTHERGRTRSSGTMLKPAKSITIGFSPSCACNADVVAGTVLDPFGGAGTTGMVADRLGRNATLIELNPEYADMAERRIKSDAGMFADVSNKPYDAMDDFAKSLDVGYRHIRERVANGGPRGFMDETK